MEEAVKSGNERLIALTKERYYGAVRRISWECHHDGGHDFGDCLEHDACQECGINYYSWRNEETRSRYVI